MNDIETRKQAVLAAIAERESALAAAEAAKAEIRADLMTILGRITALKTIWALMPQSYRDVISKYTDAEPE